MDFEISTYWNVEPLWYVFNAVSATVQNSDYTGLLKLSMYLGAFVGVLWIIMGRQIELVRWLISAIIFASVINLPVARVTITDRTGYEGPRVVENVPWSLALGASTFTHIRDWLTDTTETVLSLPDEIAFKGHDLGFAHRILRAANEVTISDPELRSDVMQFIKECTMYDIRDTAVDPGQLLSNADSWNYLFANTNKARFVTTRILSGKMIMDTCDHVANGTGSVGSNNGLKQRLHLNEKDVLRQTGRRLNPQITDSNVAAALVASQIGSASDFLWSAGSSAATSIRQAMFNNMWREAGVYLPQMLNDPAAVSATNAATIAAAQTNTQLRAQTIMAEETLPRFHNAIEFILIALFPIILPIMLTQTPEKAKAVLMNYFASMAWVALWPMLFAVLNFLMTINLARKAKWVAGIDGVPFSRMGPFQGMLMDDQAMMGYLVWLVPAIAAGIVKLGYGPMSGSFDRAFGITQGAAGSAAAQTTMGNYQTGTQSHDSMTQNMTTAHKYNMDYVAQHGAMSMRMGNGTTVTRYDAAVSTIAEAQNSLAMSDLTRDGDRLNSSLTANRHTNFDRESFTGSGRRDAADLTRYIGHDETHGQHQGLNTGFRLSDAGGEDRSANQQITSSLGAFRQDRYDQADRTALTEQASLSGGVSFGRGGGGGAGGKSGGGSGGGKAGLGGHVGLNVSGGMDATYSAERARNHGLNHDVGDADSASTGQHRRTEGGIDTTYTAGPQSAQTDSNGARASFTQGQYYENGERVSVRTGEGIDYRSGVDKFKETGTSFDQLRAVDLAEKLQQTYGISPFRFANMSVEQRKDLLQDFMARRQIQQMVTPVEYLDNARHIHQKGAAARNALGNQTAGAYHGYAGQTGSGNVAPVQAPSGFANMVSDRIESADAGIEQQSRRIAADQSHVTQDVTGSLDKNNSRSKDVGRRAAADIRSVLGKDSNDNKPDDYSRPAEPQAGTPDNSTQPPKRK